MRRGSIGLTVAVASMLAFALPEGAAAGHGHNHGHHQPCTSSAVCQYLEHIPGAGGDQSTVPGGGGGGGGHPPISPAAENALESHGTVGAKTLVLANATAPAGVPHVDGGAAGSSQTAEHGALVGAGGGPNATGGAPEIGKALSHVLGTGDAGSGMGIVLPIIMLLSLVAALLLAVARRRGAIGG